VFTWLNTNNGAVQACAAIAIALLTFWLVWINRKYAKTTEAALSNRRANSTKTHI